MAACQVSPVSDQFASAALAYLDCQAQTLGAGGYAALAAPGSSVSLLLTLLLTILIAIVGYRLILGDTPSLREGVLTFVKIGVVLALASSWPAYQAVIYDVVLRTPATLASEIAAPSALPGVAGDLPSRLDRADQSFRALSIYGAGPIPSEDTQAAAFARAEPPLWIGFDTFALGASRMVFLATAIGGFALVRIVAGLLLALGPLFLAFLLFEATRSLFEGWARGLVFATLGALAISILLAIEIAFIEPWQADLLLRRANGGSIAGMPAPLFATTLIFALVLVGLLRIMTKIGFSFRLPLAMASIIRERSTATERSADRAAVIHSSQNALVATGRDRAVLVADAIAAADRRDQQTAGRGVGPATGPTATASGSRPDAAWPTSSTRQNARQRTARRVSAGSRRRDVRL